MPKTPNVNNKFREILEQSIRKKVLVYKIPTQAEIAREFGVSRTTVLAWLNGTNGISKKTLFDSGAMTRLDWIGNLARELYGVIKEEEKARELAAKHAPPRINKLAGDYVRKRTLAKQRKNKFLYVSVMDNLFAVIPSNGNPYLKVIDNRLVVGGREVWAVDDACIDWCIKEDVPCKKKENTVFGVPMLKG